jgi:hypothetical protein
MMPVHDEPATPVLALAFRRLGQPQALNMIDYLKAENRVLREQLSATAESIQALP